MNSTRLVALLLTLAWPLSLQAQDNPFDTPKKPAKKKPDKKADDSGNPFDSKGPGKTKEEPNKKVLGRYKLKGLRFEALVLKDSTVTGYLTYKGKEQAFKASIKDGLIAGQFEHEDATVAFKAQLEDKGGLRFRTGDTNVVLKRLKNTDMVGGWHSNKTKITVNKDGSGQIVFGGKTYDFTGEIIQGGLRSHFQVGDKRFAFSLGTQKGASDKGRLRFQTGRFVDLLVPEGETYVAPLDLSSLASPKAWMACSKEDQDKVITAISGHMKAHYEFVWTKTYKCNGQACRIATFRHIKSGLMLNLIPGGTYQMGSTAQDAIDEKPVHSCTVKPMLIGVYEVRQKLWAKFGGAAAHKWKGPELPVERISWPAAKKWMDKLGGGLRFPSESEWEFACRAGTQDTYFWGDRMDKSYCWYRGNSGSRTHKVDEHYLSKKWNAFGLVDMLGNVCEWVQDDYIGHYKDGPSTEVARVNKGRGKKVIRGGSWYHVSRNALGCADRLFYTTGRSDYILGFRVAASLPSADD